MKLQHDETLSNFACNFNLRRYTAYSPTAIAEHALSMTLCLNRHLVKAHNRVREGNFTLNGLVGAVLYMHGY